MNYAEDFKIEKKYLNLLGKYIYDTKLDKFGMISGIEINSIISGLCISLRAYYDRIHSSQIIFFEDFKNGTLKFTIIDREMAAGKKQKEEYDNLVINDIKNTFGDEFREDMIIHISDDERTKRNRENDKREIQNISKKILSISKLSSEIFYDDYTVCETYKKYLTGEVSETEMLYIICNHLCEETKRLKEENLNYFIANHVKEKAELIVDYVSRKNEVDRKTEGKIIDDQ